MLAPLVEGRKSADALAMPDAVRPGRGKPGRVMFLLSNLALDGGSETQAIQLAIALKARGWDVQVVSMLVPKSGVSRLLENGVPALSLKGRSKLQAASMLWRLARLIRERRPDVVHAHMSHAVLLARAARLLQPMPVLIGTLHGLKMYNSRGTGWRIREMINGLTDGLSDVTSVVCEAAGQHYLSSRAVSRARLRLIPNGIDTSQFRADLETRLRMRESLGVGSEFTWLLAGRFNAVKDHCTMLRAFGRVCAAQSSSLLLLAGKGPLQAEMAELAEALGVAARVRFLGARRDMPSLMNAADACVLSSVYEAMPMVLLEAGATGLPSVATDTGGNCEVVLDGITGYLAPARDPEALAHAMLRLTSAPEAERAAMGARAREHVFENYRLETVVDRWESLYSELLGRKGARA